MMRLKVERISEGLHPSETIVAVKTSTGLERVVVSARSIDSNSIAVGWPLGKSDAYSSTSVDLTLDPVLTLFAIGEAFVKKVVDPTHEKYNIDAALKELTKSHTIDLKSGFDLEPNDFILAWTAEYVHLPVDSRLAARVEGKSSLARMGIGVHITAPTIHAGFDGQIRLEIVNHGHLPIKLRPGMKICQLIFEQTLGTPQKGYQGQFSGQGVK